MDGGFSGLRHRVVETNRADIHPSSVIAPGAVIAEGVRIGPFCTVGADVVLEAGVQLVSHVVVEGHTSIGPGTIVYPFASIGLAPQDFKYRGEPTRCEIGAGVQVREQVSIHRGTASGRGVTSVGDGCMVMAVAHIAHDCALGDGVVVANNVVMGGHVSIGDNAMIGGQSAILQNVRIGRGAMVSGVSGVAADLIPFGHIVGHRAALCGLNLIGLKRRGFTRARIAILRQAYQLLFLAGDRFAEQVAALRASPLAADPAVAEMLAFIAAPSKRGLLHDRSRQRLEAPAAS